MPGAMNGGGGVGETEAALPPLQARGHRCLAGVA
jgi:hypothetical protein